MKPATGATIDPEARYLDHERVIRELEVSERNHELDAAGVIEKLKDAVATCQGAADRYAVRAAETSQARDAYIIARGKYLAEIKRRVRLPSGYVDRTLVTPERPGWTNWCKNNGIASTSYADSCILAAAGDLTRINRRRKESKERGHERRARPTLEKIKSMWMYLSPAEREEFIRWALSQKDYGPPVAETRRASEIEAHA